MADPSPQHSILIAHRDRNDRLDLCLRSLKHSAEHCGLAPGGCEILVLDGGSQKVPESDRSVRVVSCGRDEPLNKARLLNVGIEQSRGAVLSVVDADAVVGSAWMDAALQLPARPELTKLCYRVRILPLAAAQGLMAAMGDPARFAEEHFLAFRRYNSRRRAFEAYGLPHKCGPRRRWRKPLFGNSQFSIRRAVLGDLRYDEAYRGRGFEDIAFNLAIWQRHVGSYEAALASEPALAMYHVENPPQLDLQWGAGGWNEQNKLRYYAAFRLWRRTLARKVRL